VRIPAVLALAGYILMQLAGAWMQVQGFSNVSALGHLGGAVVGLAVALYVRLTRRRGAAVASKDGLAQSAR
jgi:membrane associated rhomboid family serine protease